MSDSYKIYASKDYVDSKSLPDGATAHQQLVTDADGVAKWEDRLCYVIDEASKLQADNVSITVSDNWAEMNALQLKGIVAGAEYTITVDGTEYLVTATDCSNVSGWEDWVVLGNLAFANDNRLSNDTGEPFLFEWYSGGDNTTWFYHQTNGEHVISVVGATAHQQLVTDADGNVKWEDKLAYHSYDLVWESHINRDVYYDQLSLPEGTKVENTGNSIIFAYSPNERFKGDLAWLIGYTVVYDGGEVVIAASDFDASGNLNLLVYGGSGLAVDATTGAITVTTLNMGYSGKAYYAIQRIEKNKLKTIDPKYLSEEVPVIQSAQVGQTIVVKSVDENGKPTEWEAVDIPTELPSVTVDDAGKIIRVQSDGTYALETLETEEWTFTLDDGTEVVKNVVVL